MRLLAWNIVIGCLWLLGAVWPAQVREWVWALAIAIDLLGAAVGFYVPGLGRSQTSEWTIAGNLFAERCQAFILIALGESIVVIGAASSGLHTVTGLAVAAFVVAFVGSAGRCGSISTAAPQRARARSLRPLTLGGSGDLPTPSFTPS